MKREDDQQLWDFLGRARQVELSPFFARNVVRKVREQPQRADWLWRWLTPRKLVPIAGLAVAILAAAIALHQPRSRDTGENAPDVIAKVARTFSPVTSYASGASRKPSSCLIRVG